jgi:hypothetical protein
LLPFPAFKKMPPPNPKKEVKKERKVGAKTMYKKVYLLRGFYIENILYFTALYTHL